MGDGVSITRKHELQKVLLENVVTPLISFLEYGLDEAPIPKAEETNEIADRKIEECKSKESPESDLDSSKAKEKSVA